jgi:hypothetical protein
MKRARTNPPSVAVVEREQLENFEDAQARRPAPPLVEKPSVITLDAIAIVRPWTLYKLLHLDALSEAPLHLRRTQRAAQDAKRIGFESARWLKVERHIRAAIDAATIGPNATADSAVHEAYCASCDLFGHACFSDDERLFSLCEWLIAKGAAGGLVDPRAINMAREVRENQWWRKPGATAEWIVPRTWDELRVALEIQHVLYSQPGDAEFFALAHDLGGFADRARALADGVSDPMWNSLQRARADADRSPKDITAVTRMRATMLDERLGWSRGKIAELIIASENDWSPAPVKLAPALKDPGTLRDRFRDLVDPRSNRRR